MSNNVVITTLIDDVNFELLRFVSGMFNMTMQEYVLSIIKHDLVKYK